MMTQRVVDVFEMVKVDVENGGIAARLPYSVDRRFQPLAEEHAVGQGTKRVVHGKVPQPRLSRRNCLRGLPHMPEDEPCEHRECG